MNPHATLHPQGDPSPTPPRHLKTVLVSVHPYPSPQAVPLGAAFLKSYLLTDEELCRNVDVVLLDFFLGDPVERCAAAILDEAPDAVGFSMYLWNREQCTAMASALRRTSPPLVLFAGGPEPTADTARVMEESCFDFVLRGEGEIPFLRTMARLYEGKGLEGVRGVVTGPAGVAGSDTEEPSIIDTLPSPYLSGTLDLSRYPGVLWQLSRGCAFRCDFCFDHRGKGLPRRFSFDRLRAELELFAYRGVSQVFVLDSTFNHDPKRAKEILRLIAKVAPHIHFHFEARSESLDREMARLFARVNCSVQIGLQSADVAVQRKVHRAFDPDDFIAKISLLNEQGAIFGFDVMYGLPGDTLAGFRHTVDFALSLLPNHLDIFPLAVLPGTRLHMEAEASGLVHRPYPPYTLMESPTFPAADMRSAARLAASCDIFYSRGKAVAWFRAVIQPLSLSPSQFLEQFYDWLLETGKPANETDLSDDDIWRMQLDFLEHLYSAHHAVDLLAAAEDLVNYHHHYAAALMTAAPDLPTDRELERMDLLGTAFVLPPSTRLVTFHYEILDILEMGDVDLVDFVDCFSPTGSQAAIYPRAGEVFTESLDPRYFELLSRFKVAAPAAPELMHIPLTREETTAFLDFAAAEGILVPAAPSPEEEPFT